MNSLIFNNLQECFLSLAKSEQLKGEQYRVIFLLLSYPLNDRNPLIHIQKELMKRLNYSAARISKSFSILESINLIYRIYPEPEYHHLWYYLFNGNFPSRQGQTNRAKPASFPLFFNSIDAFTSLALNKNIQGQTFKVILVLLAHLNGEKGIIKILPSKVARILGINNSNVSRHLKLLVEINFLKKQDLKYISNFTFDQENYVYVYSLNFDFPDFNRSNYIFLHPFNRERY